MRMSASTVEAPSVDRKSHMILLRHELPLSQQGVWTGITRQISMTCRKLGKRSCTWKVQSFPALDSHRTAVKTPGKINNYFHLNSTRCKHRHRCYNSIGVAQRKPNFRFCEKFAQNFATSCQKTFLSFKMLIHVNIIICSILTLFPSCKHRHRYYIGIVQICEQLRFFNFVKWNMIPRVPHDFISSKEFICHLSLFTNKKVNHSIAALISNLNFLFGPINYVHDVYYSRCFKFRTLWLWTIWN